MQSYTQERVRASRHKAVEQGNDTQKRSAMTHGHEILFVAGVMAAGMALNNMAGV